MMKKFSAKDLLTSVLYDFEFQCLNLVLLLCLPKNKPRYLQLAGL
jgi:hypothetical protein